MMEIIKLDRSHRELVKKTFTGNRYMGTEIDENTWGISADIQNLILFNRFADAYLSDLNSFHAYAALDPDSGEIATLISYYEASDEPSWYYTLCRGSGNIAAHRATLDHILEINESRGRLKFYTLVNARHVRVIRRFGWSERNSERYGYFDEYLVPEKCRCFYSTHWDVLFKRALLPQDTVVRCSFLKQEYRTELPLGGSI